MNKREEEFNATQNSDKSASVVNRRGFIKGAGLAGLGAMSLGALGACSPGGGGGGASAGGTSNASNVNWDKEVDVLVVGSGTATFAAVIAKDLGAGSVTIIEKDERWGGTSSTSGGTLWIPLFYAGQEAGMADTREDALAYMKLCAAGRGNEAAMEQYVDNANVLCEHMRDTHGWEWTCDTPGAGFKDYYEPLEGFRSQGRQANLEGGGTGLWAALQTLTDKLDIEVLHSTAASQLITDDAGTVVGVVADKDGSPLAIKANTCVVLGTGGFDHNPEMVHAFQSIPLYVTVAAMGNIGDGHIMGGAIGAALGNMDTNWGLPSFVVEPFDPGAEVIYDIVNTDWGIYRAGAGSIVVNKKGRRFANEATAYALFNRAFGSYATEDPGWANIPAVWICDSNYVLSGGGLLPGQADPADPLPAHIFKADTLGEIAEHFGIDAAGLEEEVARFNGFAATGVDLDFHRGDTSADQSAGAYHPYHSELPNAVLAPIATGPFYASLYVPGTCGTNGGLKTNEYAQVLNTRGEVIPGLLAVGNCSASISGGQYCGAGMTLGAGAVMSYVGIKHILGS